jgi:hypothetical protein
LSTLALIIIIIIFLFFFPAAVFCSSRIFFTSRTHAPSLSPALPFVYARESGAERHLLMPTKGKGRGEKVS